MLAMCMALLLYSATICPELPKKVRESLFKSSAQQSAVEFRFKIKFT